MAEVHVVLESLNPNIKSFQRRELPGRFHVDHANGTSTEHTFVDSRNQVADFDIGNGGIIKLNDESPIDKHNIDTLKVLEQHKHKLPPYCSFRLVDLRQNRIAEQADRNLRVEALLAIRQYESDPSFIGSIARRLGLPGLATMTPDDVRNRVEAMAESQPKEVLAILKHHYQTELFEIDKAKEAKIIEKNANGFFYYGGVIIGTDEASMISFFQTNPVIYDEIKRRNAQNYPVPQPVTPAVSQALAQFNQAQRPVDPLVNKPLTPAITIAEAVTQQVNSEQFFSDTPPALNPEIVQLIDAARVGGIITETDEDEDTTTLMFNGIPLTDNQPGTMEDRAARMLALQPNEGLLKKIKQANARVKPQ